MTRQRQKLGKTAENLALKFLQKNNYQILAQNLRTKFGEIDILAQSGKTIVIIEVKAKSGPLFGIPEEMVYHKKREKLRKLASFISMKYPQNDIRIDVVAVDWRDERVKIRHIINAVEGR